LHDTQRFLLAVTVELIPNTSRRSLCNQCRRTRRRRPSGRRDDATADGLTT